MNAEKITRLAGIHDQLADSHPALARGMVWCRSCGRSERVYSAYCLRHGWPKCCGYTMTIDHPDTWPFPNEKDHDRA